MEEEKALTVNKANELIQNFQTDLTKQEWDIFDFIVANIKSPFVYDSKGNKMEIKDSSGKVISSYDTKFNEIRFTFKDFSRIVYNKPNPSGKDYKMFEEAVERLENRRSKKILLTQGEKAGYNTKLKIINKMYDRGTDDKDIILKLDDDMIPYLLQLKNGYEYDEQGNVIDKPTPFTSYKLNYKVRLRTKYAKRLYEVLKSYENLKGGIFPSSINGISIDSFKELLSVPEGYKYSNIKNRILDEAIDQINENTDIHVTYQEIKERKKVIALRFKIEKQSESKVIRAIAKSGEQTPIYKTLTEENFMIFFEVNTIEKYNDVNARLQENVLLSYDMPEGTEITIFVEKYMQRIMDSVLGKEIRDKWKYLRKILENDYKDLVKATKGTLYKKGIIENDSIVSTLEVFKLCKEHGNTDIELYKKLDDEEKSIVSDALYLYNNKENMTDKDLLKNLDSKNFSKYKISLIDLLGEERAKVIKMIKEREFEELLADLK